MTEVSYTYARAHLAELCDKAVDDLDEVTIRRRGADDVTLIASSELSGLKETVHLLSSPENARLLLAALERLRRGEGREVTTEQLREELFGSAARNA